MLYGKEYDYVFDVDLGDGIMKKLGYNKGENPYMVAQVPPLLPSPLFLSWGVFFLIFFVFDFWFYLFCNQEFLHREELDQEHLDQVARFIMQNADVTPMTIGGPVPVSDPLTGTPPLSALPLTLLTSCLLFLTCI